MKIPLSRIKPAVVVLCAFCPAFFASCMTSPAFVGAAMPLIIGGDSGKLSKNPGNEALRLETGSYCVMYANAFIETPAKTLPQMEYERRNNEFAKAKKYYLRGVSILREGLDKKYPGINDSYKSGTLSKYLPELTKGDVPSLYWTVAGTLAAYALDPLDISIGVKIPELSVLIKRAYELDPNFNNGALDEFFISFYGALPPALGGDPELAKKFFNSAVQKSGGNSAGPYMSYLESIAIGERDYKMYMECINKALAADLKKLPSKEDVLANKIALKKARFYLKNKERFFPEEEEND